jgi:hypothetical protein
VKAKLHSIVDRPAMSKVNAFVLGLCALILIVFGYSFWINAAH